MLDLIYTGNEDAAWKWFERAWPDGVSKKAEFLKEFKEKLANSNFWPDVNVNGTLQVPTFPGGFPPIRPKGGFPPGS